eukprot:2137425-Amphidinium_carterae.1
MPQLRGKKTKLFIQKGCYGRERAKPTTAPLQKPRGSQPVSASRAWLHKWVAQLPECAALRPTFKTAPPRKDRRASSDSSHHLRPGLPREGLSAGFC